MTDGEDRIKEMAEGLVLTQRERMRNLIKEQIELMAYRGVFPSWKNFTVYGEAWDNIKKLLTSEARFEYYRLWQQTLKELNYARNNEG